MKLQRTSDRTYRRVRNQYMSRARRVAVKKTHSGLKAKTWASIVIIVLLLAIIETPIVTFGKASKVATSSVGIAKAWAMNHTFVMPSPAFEPERVRNTQLIKTIFGKDAQQAIKVFTCESGLRTMAMNEHNSDGFPDVGIAQIHVTDKSAFTVPEMQSPVANLYRAKEMFDSRGWQPWDSSKACWGVK
jgi:hypothetical protein